MPAFLDFMNQRFGKLLVVALADRGVYGGINMPMWRCRCDCGTEEVVPRVRLTSSDRAVKVDRCQACRARTCVQCGKVFIPTTSRVMTCSEVCREERRRWRTTINTRAREAADPTLKQRYSKNYRERRAKSPFRAEEARAYQRQWASKNRARLKADRLARLDTLPPEEAAAICAAERAKAAATQRRIRAEAKANDPARYEAILERVRRNRTGTALAGIMTIGDELQRRFDREEDR